MTTPAAAAIYLQRHLATWHGRGYALYNPHDRLIEDLPVIFGFNNGGELGWMSGCLLAEDGTYMGGHICSHEDYMPHDLGVLEGSRPDRHEGFREHYPDGYRMDFVGYDAIRRRPDLLAAVDRAKKLKSESEEPAQ